MRVPGSVSFSRPVDACPASPPASPEGEDTVHLPKSKGKVSCYLMNSARPMLWHTSKSHSAPIPYHSHILGVHRTPGILEIWLWLSAVVRHNSIGHGAAPWCVPNCMLLSTPYVDAPTVSQGTPSASALIYSKDHYPFLIASIPGAAPRSFNCSVWLLTYNTLGTGCFLGYSRNTF